MVVRVMVVMGIRVTGDCDDGGDDSGRDGGVSDEGEGGGRDGALLTVMMTMMMQ